MNEPENYHPNGIDPIPEPVHPKPTTRAVNWFFAIALAITAIAIGIFLKWSFQSTDVLEVKNSPFPVRTVREHPSADGVVILMVDFCKNQAIDGKVRTSFVSASREIFLPVSDEKLSKGCLKTEVPVLIPKDIIPDTYKIKFRTTYDINPLKRGVVIEFESKPVEIVAPTP